MLSDALAVVRLRGAWFSPRARERVRFRGGGKDLFVRATILDRSGLSELPEGHRMRMQISQGQKGPEARSIEPLDYRLLCSGS